MHFDLVMLRSAKWAALTAQEAEREAERLALRSFDGSRVRDGTIGQVEKIVDMQCLARKLYEFVRIVRVALESVAPQYRALLVTLYVREGKVRAITERYRVPPRRVYRAVRVAREKFRRRLLAEGHDGQWFRTEYAQLYDLYAPKCPAQRVSAG